jgi:hypothetical protein
VIGWESVGYVVVVFEDAAAAAAAEVFVVVVATAVADGVFEDVVESE